jgi:hypothetical protein
MGQRIAVLFTARTWSGRHWPVMRYDTRNVPSLLQDSARRSSVVDLCPQEARTTFVSPFPAQNTDASQLFDPDAFF